MENNKHYHVTKDAALRQIGVSRKRDRETVAQLVDIGHVAAGCKLMTAGHFELSLLVGVSGSIVLSSSTGEVARFDAPFVIDSWATDERGVGKYTVLADSDSSVLLIDRRARATVFGLAPRLRLWARATAEAFDMAKQDVVVDIRSRTATPVHN